jgi:hypothetical protein
MTEETKAATEEHLRGWCHGYDRIFADHGHLYGSDYAEGYREGLAERRHERMAIAKGVRHD